MATGAHYKILRKLGTGGFSDVFLARDMSNEGSKSNSSEGAIVALKVIVK